MLYNQKHIVLKTGEQMKLDNNHH